MRLRFCDQVVEKTISEDDADAHCVWCGFRHAGRLHSYEDDTGTLLACDICLDARHVTHAISRDSYPSKMVWMPEIAQADLAHIVRCASVMMIIHADCSPLRKDKAASDAQDRAMFFMEMILARSDIITTLIADSQQNGPAEFARFWDDLPAETQSALHGGLRLVPTGFAQTTVESWMNDDTSLSGFGIEHVKENNWFRSRTKVLPDAPIPALESVSC